MTYDTITIWGIIVAMGAGTFGLRFCFLGLIGSRPMPEWVLRHLRYTAVAVLPGLIAPLVLWPAATGGALDPARLSAALATLSIGIVTKNVVLSILTGGAVLYGMMWLI